MGRYARGVRLTDVRDSLIFYCGPVSLCSFTCPLFTSFKLFSYVIIINAFIIIIINAFLL